MSSPFKLATAAANEQSPFANLLRLAQMISRVQSILWSAVERNLARDRMLGPLQITGPQFVVLATLDGGDANSAADLCKIMGYDTGAMTRMIDRLECKGLVRRLREPHRRLIKLSLTETAVVVIPALREAARLAANEMLSGFSRDEAIALEGLLARMLIARTRAE